jgi:PadR family transcriptional regulator, regulatory protein PadR
MQLWEVFGYMTSRITPFTAGVSELLVLGLLARREMYGYELAKAVQAATRQEIHLGEGLLYPLLHGLELQKLLRSRRVTVSGRPRIYYRTTANGRRRLAKLVEQWRRSSAAVDSALGGVAHA